MTRWVGCFLEDERPPPANGDNHTKGFEATSLLINTLKYPKMPTIEKLSLMQLIYRKSYESPMQALNSPITAIT